MICPQCGREMEPIREIPFRWQCDNHPMRLFVQEPPPTLWYLDPAEDQAGEERRIAAQLAAALRNRVVHPPAPECPSCHSPMQYNLVLNQWECNRYMPPYILTAEEHMRRGQPTTRTIPVMEPPNPEERIARRKQQELEASYCDAATEWFNDMPKALKILYISTDKESEGMMSHFKELDPRRLTFRSLYGSCQRMLIHAYIEQHPKKEEVEVPF